jgi:hypothetical protein
VLQQIFRVAHASRVLVPVRLGLSASRRNSLFWGAQATCLPFFGNLAEKNASASCRRQQAGSLRSPNLLSRNAS